MNQAISKQLLSRLTHHVRNPFNGIIGFSDLLTNHFDKLSDDDLKNYIQIVHQLSKKALLRSENFSWWLKAYTENITPVMQQVNLVELLNDELSYYQAEIRKQDLEINIKTDDSIYISTDKVMVQNIIRNCLMNIIEFTPQMEVVTIELSSVKEKAKLTFTNVFQGEITEEITTFINQMNLTQVDYDKMPDNGGFWVIQLLCSALHIDRKIKSDKGKFKVEFIFN